MKHPIQRLAALLCLVILPLSFNVETASATQELIVSAAASLTNAFGEVGKQFEAANPGTKVICNFASSGALLQQITQGAPVDVFASADEKTMDQAQERSLIVPGTRRDFVRNELVVIIPSAAGLSLTSVQELTRKEFGKIALGNPETVPAGRYAQEVLSNEGIWQEVTPKLIFGNSVRQVLDYVNRGEVDAGFVFSTDAALAKEKVKMALEAKNHKPISYPISVVSATKHEALAKRFIEFVLSPQGLAVLAEYGFKGPGPAD